MKFSKAKQREDGATQFDLAMPDFPYAATSEERQRILTELHEGAYRVVPYLPVGRWVLPVAYGPRLNGVLGMRGIIIMWNIEKAAR